MSNGSDNGGVSEVLVRRDVASLGPAAISRLRRAFQVLRERSARDEDDPVGLLGQANIHRDSCSHATWWFLPWHRAYLYYFEQVLRDAAGDPTLTLPYWDWTSAPRLPAAFWGPDNPLNDPTREITPEMAAAEAFVGQPVIEATLETADFVTFASERSTDPLIPVAYGILEGTPHNYIHRFVGGRQGNMANPALAARDPIFWLHHANVDRLWTAWAAAHAGRTPTDPSWLGQPFTFVDAQGRPVAITTAETLDTDRLNYRYDTPPVPAARPEGVSAVTEQAPSEAAPPPGPRLRVEASPARPVISRQPLTLTLRPDDPMRERVSLAAAAAPEAQGETLRLEVEGVTPHGNPDVGVRVFLNLPAADASTPPSDPHYVTTFAFFEHESHESGRHPHGPKTFYANVTPAVRRLRAAGLYQEGEPLQVTLVTVPIAPAGEAEAVEIPFERLSLSVP